MPRCGDVSDKIALCKKAGFQERSRFGRYAGKIAVRPFRRSVMSNLHRLVYVSQVSRPIARPEMDRLLDAARLHNTARGISGLLLHHRGQFFQVLEGPEVSVETLFARISRDPRHCAVEVLDSGPVAARAFGDWAMGFVDPSGLKPERMMALHRMRALICRATTDPVLRLMMTGFLSGHHRALAS